MLRSLQFSRCVLPLVLLINCQLQAEEWPRFRGLQGCGVSSSTDLPTAISPDQHVLWKAETAAGSSSPVIAAGKLFLAAYSEDARTLQCFDAATGEQLWKRSEPKLREESSSQLNGPATCTPVTDGEHVIVFFPDTALLCYTTAGELCWRAEVGPFHSMHGIANSPVVAEGKVLLMADQLQGSFLAAYDLKTGEQVWKQGRADGLTGGYSTPVIVQKPNQTTRIITSGPGGLITYELATGKPLASLAGVANAPVTLPILQGSQAILCEPVGEAMSIGMMLPAYDKDKDGKLAFEEVEADIPMLRLVERIERGWGNGDEMVDGSEWDKAFGSFIDKGGLVAVELADGVAADSKKPSAEVVWNYRKSVPYVASPVIYEGLLYMVKDGGVVTIIDPADGKMVLEKRLRKGGKPVYASPIAADGKIFILDTAGQLTVLKAGREWNELHTVSMKEPCMATPAICDGRIYIRTRGHLYCFGNPAP